MNLRFLVVDDNADDLLLIERAFRRAGHEPPEVARSGAQALARLHEQPGEPAPQVVVLDLKLAGLDGIEVLERIRFHPTTRALPVVVLSTSNEPRDIERAYDRGANSYLRKPVEFEAFAHVVATLTAYWALNLVPESRPT